MARVYHKQEGRSKRRKGMTMGDAGTRTTPQPLPALAVLVLAACVVLSLLACSSDDGQGDFLVFAAASLYEPLEEARAAFERDSGISVLVSYGGSQALAQQIVSGAPAALFVPAGVFPVSFVEERVALAREPAPILRNRLVLAVRTGEGARADSIAALADAGVERIAIADPELAPAGRYARESLEHHGVWERIQPKLVFGADVRAALAYVESGNADVALVYATDAASSGPVSVGAVVPEDSHSPIVYPAAVIAGSGQEDSAWKLVEYLRSAEAREVFGRYGFTAEE